MSIHKRIMTCIAILSVLVSILVLYSSTRSREHVLSYTAANPAVATTGGVFFGDNWRGNGYLYRFGSKGKVEKLTGSASFQYERIDGLCVVGGNVYALYSSLEKVDGEDRRLCLICVYDSDLRLLGYIPPFVLDEAYRLTGLWLEDETFFVTALSEGGTQVLVYRLDGSDFFNALPEGTEISLSQVKKRILKPSVAPVFLSRESASGRFFVDAVFRENELKLLMDTDKPYGIFMPDRNVADAVSKAQFTYGQQLVFYRAEISVWFVGLVLWLLFLYLLYRRLVDRDRAVYVFLVTEIVYIIILLSGVLAVRQGYTNAKLDELYEYTGIALSGEMELLDNFSGVDFSDPGFYETDEYRSIRSELAGFILRGDNEKLFRDIFVLGLEDDTILVSVNGHNRENAGFVYGPEIHALSQKLLYESDKDYRRFYLDDVSMTTAGHRVPGGNYRYALVALCYSGEYELGFWSEFWNVVLFIALCFVLGSIIIAIVMYFQSVDLKAFVGAIEDVALGSSDIRLPESLAKDMRAMWTALSEICKRLEEISHEKVRLLEAYFRFAPKNIETIMGKDSIFDVKNGDMVRQEGTILLISAEQTEKKEEKSKTLTNIVTFMSDYNDNQDGILVSHSGDLTLLQFLFLGENKEVALRTNHFLHRNIIDDTTSFVSAFLYYDSFLYGVAGINSQSLVYLTSEVTRLMSLYADWFKSLRVPLVLTEDVLSREEAGECRHIGFLFEPEGKRRIELYELLDANPAKERQLKLITREKFEKALSVFYEEQYYQARNLFSEVLKECPEDLVAKWYVFESERYLNGERDEQFQGRLRAEV